MMTEFKAVEFETVRVGWLKAEDGVQGAPAAHKRLEELVPDVAELTSYGIHFKFFDVYYAAVEFARAAKEMMAGNIQGGQYLSASLPNLEHVSEINPLFIEMDTFLGDRQDMTRPRVEVYHGLGEIMLLAPMRD